VAALGESQAGVVTRQQLAAVDVTHDQIRNEVKAGRWQVDGQVVVLQSGPLTELQSQWAAVLAQPPGATLAGITAAKAGGLRWITPEDVHVLLPKGARPSARDGVVVHLSRRFSAQRDAHPLLTPPRTRFDRSVIDAASWAPTDRRACGVIAAAVQQRLAPATGLREALESAGQIARRRLIGQLIGDVEGGIHSFAELDFESLARQAGLGPPLRQARRRDSNGLTRYLDKNYGGFQVEIDGALHLLPSNYWDDMKRQNELTIGGDHVLHFPTAAIRLKDPIVVVQLRAAAAKFGTCMSKVAV
jgi:hypothetical protein